MIWPLTVPITLVFKDSDAVELNGTVQIEVLGTAPGHNGEYPTTVSYIIWTSVQTTCECGADKVGCGGHSHWCPKYE